MDDYFISASDFVAELHVCPASFVHTFVLSIKRTVLFGCIVLYRFLP